VSAAGWVIAGMVVFWVVIGVISWHLGQER
jgi:hypothetical protein